MLTALIPTRVHRRRVNRLGGAPSRRAGSSGYLCRPSTCGSFLLNSVSSLCKFRMLFFPARARVCLLLLFLALCVERALPDAFDRTVFVCAFISHIALPLLYTATSSAFSGTRELSSFASVSHTLHFFSHAKLSTRSTLYFETASSPSWPRPAKTSEPSSRRN